MRQVLSKLAWIIILWMVICAALALVVISIMGAGNIGKSEFSDFLSSTAAPDEVKSYSLFTSVRFGNRKVTTGTRYGSTYDQIIESQWCYLAGNEMRGQSFINLTLANMDSDGRKTIPDFDDSELAEFSLDQDEVHRLIASHCRFEDQ